MSDLVGAPFFVVFFSFIGSNLIKLLYFLIFRVTTRLFINSYLQEMKDSGASDFWIGASGTN